MPDPTTPTPSEAIFRRTWVEVSASALRHNVAVARERVGGAGGVMAVVKAGAYGLGVEAVVPPLAAGGVDAFAVATLDEARDVHRMAAGHPIYLLSTALPAERAAVVGADFRVIPAVSSAEEAREFSRLAVAAGRRVPIHFVLDTGMGRMGLVSDDSSYVVSEIREAASLPGVWLDSVASHCPSADEDRGFTGAQLARYRALLDALTQAGQVVDHHHIANSAGTLTQSRCGPEWVRAGLMLLGVSPVPEIQEGLREAVRWQTRVMLARTLPAGHGVSYGRTFITQRPTRVATLATGYADGYPRHLSGQGAWVWLGGCRCPVLGRVTMDQIMVEAPDDVQPGDVATLLGGPGPSATELATRAGTIPYEIFCGLGQRVARLATP
ncbi:MAG: alanine racemase [Verrucomicrobiales bacterium]